MATPTTLTRWSLDDLFTAMDGEDVQQAFDELHTRVEQFEQNRDALSAEMPVEQFLNIVQEVEDIQHLGQRLNGFAGLLFAADTQDQQAQTFNARVDDFLAGIRNRMLFFNLWWKDLEQVQADRFLQEASDFRYWLEEIRHFKPYTLSEPEEKVINLKNVTGVNAFNNLYDSITNRYTFRLVVDGEAEELTRGELMVYARHHDPDLRAAAYQELYRVYGEDGPILGQIYQTIARDWRNEQLEMRGFEQPISARNLANDIPDPVVDTLLEVSERNAPVFQRFFRLKARLLGLERLRRYDVYAPVVQADREFGFDEAADLVLSSFRQFEPEVAELAQRVFTANRLDSEVRKGKRGGAFCWTVVPDMTPWVLLNYQGRPDDVATMAHELGHAVHSMLASEHSVLVSYPSLPLAETASTFGEMLLLDRLLEQEQDPAVRRDLLFRQVDDAYATIMRQAYFAIFERTAHEMVVEGASADELSVAYQDSLRKQFGDSVDVSDEFRWEWASIPHIYHVPFYVYAYAFGQLLVFSLYQQYREEGESFKPRYREILAAGGSDSPARILQNAGIDIQSAEFWQGGYDVVAGLVSRLEELTDA